MLISNPKAKEDAQNGSLPDEERRKISKTIERVLDQFSINKAQVIIANSEERIPGEAAETGIRSKPHERDCARTI